MKLTLIFALLVAAPCFAQQPANCPLGTVIVAADNTVWACRGSASAPAQVTTGTGTASGTNTGDQTTVSGNAGTATTLATPRTINSVSFNGSANITVTAAGSTLSDNVTFARGGIGAAAATSATTGTMTVSMTTPVITITPTGDCTFNATGGVAGQVITFSVTTSGSTSFNLTFGTNFRKTGVLATGVTTARFFTVTFICIDGTIWTEVARTAVQT